MANQNTAYGLRPIGLVGSGANSTGVTQYEIASDNTNAIYQYGLVTPTSDGVVDFAGATNGGTTPALGVLMGVEYQDSTQKETCVSKLLARFRFRKCRYKLSRKSFCCGQSKPVV